MSSQPRPLRDAFGKIARAFARVGLPALGTAIGGPAGGIVAATVGSLLGVDPQDDDALESAIASASPETLVRLREIEASLAAEAHATARADYAAVQAHHAADMASDSWLSKNIRPLALATTGVCYLVLTATVAFLLPLERAAIALPLMDGVTALLVAQVGFYFGGRTLEKGTAIFRRKP